MTRMKESGIDWIGQIPEEWESGKVKYFSKISAGATPDRNNLLFWNGDINWMSSGEVNQEIVKYTAETITNLALKNSSTKLLPIGTVMLAMNGQGKTKGTVAILAIETASNQSLASFIVDGNRLNNQYLYYFFKAGYSYIRGLKGEDRDGLNLQLVSNITVPLFDIKEQQKIADFLDKKTTQLDKAKALLEEQIQKLKDYRSSLIYETVTKGLDKTVPMKDSGIDWIGQVPEGWGVKAIKYIFDEIGSGSTPKSDNEIFYDGDINWIQSGDLYQTDTVTSVSKTISYQGFRSTSALKIYQPPFVALAMYGASVGNVAVSYIDACVNQAVVVMSGSSEKVGFGKYAIEASKSNLIFSAQGGTQPNISQNLIKNWSIPQPKSEEQDQIVDFLDNETSRIDELIKIKFKQIENINKQRQTLIYDYVTGKRRV
ncbi:restriction endonuclease subunit S [Streptococcus sp. 27098_8_186]|uniref:restriction endonuclease subunit S n=1 Tax=unclassified Streptococcus TaxID=2608887 RepID=UPI00352E9DEA